MVRMEEVTMLLKIGELAKRAGLTVRTLHHYDSIGLLSPSARSASGFRLYNQDDVVRLHRIHALKQLGCSLTDIGALLDGSGMSPLDVLTHQIAAVDEQVQRGQRLGKRLRLLLGELAEGRDTSIHDWLTIMEKMTMYEKYFSRNELAALRARQDKADPGVDSAGTRASLFARHMTAAECEQVRLRMVEHGPQWPPLIAALRQQMDAGAGLDEAPVQALARRWEALFRASYCGDDAALEAKVRSAFHEEPELSSGTGVDARLIAFVQQAILQLHRPGDEAAAGPKPSAYLVAVMRAAHQLLDAPLVFDDPLALKILGPVEEAALRASAGRYSDPMSKALRGTLVVRSRLAEDAWAAAEAMGVRQYVVLGAGLDTYGCRGAARPGSRVFEVDLPATQQWKRARLREAGIAEPAALCYVPLDFRRATLADGLAEAGFRHDQPAFFAWLGVTMYLEPEEVYATLRFIASCAAGSGVVFDHGADPELLGPAERTALQMMSAKAAERGEAWRSYFDPAQLSGKLREFGFGEVEAFGPAQLNERYLAGRADGLRVGAVTRLMHATV